MKCHLIYLFVLWQVVSVKIIRNKQTNLSEGYGFVEFVNRAAAERTLATYNGTVMPQTEQAFRLNWASLGAGQRRQDDSTDYTVFVGDLAADVTDVMLQDAFRTHYSSVKGAKVITDHITNRSKGYGFVRFGDEGEQQRAMTEMNGVVLSTRPMRTGPAANKKPATGQPKGMYSKLGLIDVVLLLLDAGSACCYEYVYVSALLICFVVKFTFEDSRSFYERFHTL